MRGKGAKWNRCQQQRHLILEHVKSTRWGKASSLRFQNSNMCVTVQLNSYRWEVLVKIWTVFWSETEREVVLRWNWRWRRGFVLAGRDLPWEETRIEGVGKEKLGQMEKSSCNDPTVGPADSSQPASPLSMSVFFSFILQIHLSLCSHVLLNCYLHSFLKSNWRNLLPPSNWTQNFKNTHIIHWFR